MKKTMHPPANLIVPMRGRVVSAWLAFTTLAAAAVDYEKEIKPLLKERCFACHGALKQKADLRLDTAAAMRKGGENGDILAGDPALLLERVTTPDKDDRMPPEGEGSMLTSEQVAKLKEWLAAGSPAPASEVPEADPRAHWAYQSPISSGKPMDALLAARMAEKNLKPQAEAAPEIWLRRVYLDLIGLPPSAEQITMFLQDTALPARRRVVDELLATPQYGERWARHFMDLWRYCDWYGLGAQLRHSQKHLWHWRDWIVESLNVDKGYDRMIVEQLAGDELAPGDRDTLRATGFLARSYYLFNRTTWLDETIEHTCRAFLGVTMQCVKCHDHKYDPIEHTDYYRMRAIFEPMHVRLDPWQGETDFEKNGLPRVYDLHLDQHTFRHVRGDEKNEDKSKPMTPGIPKVLAFAAFQPAAMKLPPSSAKPVLLPFVLSDHLRAADQQLEAAQKANDAATIKTASLRIAMIQAVYAADLARNDKSIAKAAALAEARYLVAKTEIDLAKIESAPKAKDTEKKIKAGREALANAQKKAAAPGETYASLPASLKAQEGPEESTNATVQIYPESSTGRRLAFAQWVADKRNPLTARVLVNQVWMRHFGASLVAGVDDFGLRSPAPLHQDILDTLTVDFMNKGWSLKHLHRAMVLSELYRRSSSNAGVDARTAAADPDNACYWRMNPRRMESQVVRDSLLQLAGKLDLTLGGASLNPASAETSPRRSLYFIQNADVEDRFLATFDNANVLECYRRNESVVPQQALALTNSRLSRECADALAAKLSKLDEKTFIEQSFLRVLGRPATAAEREVSLAGFVALKQNRSLFLQALLNHNDFVTLR
ncbi:PSD1 and planctomycete cytochrome C domain-containing protein [Prosthecobacter sp.]|uniref:PSD1 and planctomycete cytochrome C domain-containing protein n=1 Tax=Prosthecobacter sp. TaxID=1965333 RepID=UPI0024871DA6|nr:PSD1 and planctomycete cytochrome C domain-containing protein [Prosthecobacter sp.]MDI1313033.1 PSD1 and planctomycete cytochrome C domain-containing protein [Prosthecobacter sp.]